MAAGRLAVRPPPPRPPRCAPFGRPAPRRPAPPGPLPRAASAAVTAEESEEDDGHDAVTSSSAVIAASAPLSPLARLATAASVLYRFSRPHTIAGTAVSVLSVSALALGPGDVTPVVCARVGAALAAALLMNVCIVGVNQVYDVEIDKVNKPYLPIPAGDLSPAAAARLSAAAGAASLAVGAATASPPLVATLAASLALGLAYSADHPLLRWKRFPAAAAGCILAVRAVIVQAGFYLHALAAAALPLPATVPPPLAFAVAVFLAFSIAIALLKDVPDAAGDEAGGVRTLTVRAGPARVFNAAAALLAATYAGAVAFACTRPPGPARIVAAVAHAVVGGAVAAAAARVDAADPKQTYAFYMRVWAAFYVEYLLVPLFR